jgi:D-alanyl-D-alanine dipeptidase/carboxypeptidase
VRDFHNPVLKGVADADLHVLEEEIALETECLGQLGKLIRAAGAWEAIVVVSGFRTMEEQKAIYNGSLAENGPVFTANYVALPGCSEHQTGLAVDVGEKTSGELDFIAPSFPDHGACAVFKTLAASYGFIQRYKEGKEELTGIACEPWHFRYVGVPHAACMESLDMCLEEYIAYLRDFSYAGKRLEHAGDGWRAESYYVVAHRDGDTPVPIPACDAYRISGNNADGFIVTAYYGDGHEI